MEQVRAERDEKNWPNIHGNYRVKVWTGDGDYWALWFKTAELGDAAIAALNGINNPQLRGPVDTRWTVERDVQSGMGRPHALSDGAPRLMLNDEEADEFEALIAAAVRPVPPVGCYYDNDGELWVAISFDLPDGHQCAGGVHRVQWVAQRIEPIPPSPPTERVPLHELAGQRLPQKYQDGFPVDRIEQRTSGAWYASDGCTWVQFEVGADGKVAVLPEDGQ